MDVELCARMYVAVNGCQYGRHLKNVASYGIRKYKMVFFDSKNPHLDTKIITVTMCLAAILDKITYLKNVCRIPWPRKPWKHQKTPENPENPENTRINVVDKKLTIDVELCAKMYVAVNGGQYGRHLKNLASYRIQKYIIVFLNPKNHYSDTKIITVAILEVKKCGKMCSAILDFVKTQENFNTNLRI